jgi:outer membrane immunogenic protein
MLNQRTLYVAGAVALAGLAPMAAKAADMPQYTPPPVITAVPGWDWTGFYAGVFAGYAWGSVDTNELFSAVGGFYNPPGAPYSFDADGFFGGAQAGYNWQFDQIVLGVEAEIGYMGMDDSIIDPNSFIANIGDTASKFDSDFYGALTGRLGFAADQVLLYAKGGVAFLNGEGRTTDACAIAPCGGLLINATGNDTLVGWTVGGGLEYMITPNWTIKAEYMYFDFGDFDVAGIASNGLSYIQSMDVTAHTAKIGVNYKF